MAKSKPTLTLDTYLAILAVVSSFCAIGITFYQAYLQRTQQYASVTPILDVYHTGYFEDNTPGSAITVANVGLGPAFINSTQYYYQNRRYTDMSVLIKAVLASRSQLDSTLLISDLWDDKVLPQGEQLYLYKTTNKAVSRYLQEHHKLISCVIYYRSIYGEHWVLDPRQGRQARTRRLN